ncbi:MAG: Ig-like domain-containing domain [Planctomycetota bacterium]|jgi:hypothetical protein
MFTRAIIILRLLLTSIVGLHITAGYLYAQAGLYTPASSYNSTDRFVGIHVFHWYSGGNTLFDLWQSNGHWRPYDWTYTGGGLPCKCSWDGSVTHWENQLKDIMDANIDLIYIVTTPTLLTQRMNLFEAVKNLRSQGYDTPRVAPWLDNHLMWHPSYMGPIDLATAAGKDKYVDWIITFYNDYYSQNTDPYASDYLARIDNKMVINNWHMIGQAQHPDWYVSNSTSLTRNDVESRLAAGLGGSYPVFNNGVYMMGSAAWDPYVPSWFDERFHQFGTQNPSSPWYSPFTYNNKQTVCLLPGEWTENIGGGRYWPRNGGINFHNAWNSLMQNMNGSPPIYHVVVESWNEYSESTGCYEADPEPYFCCEYSGSNTDTWSTTNNTREYIEQIANRSGEFTGRRSLDAEFIGNDVPNEMTPAATYDLSVVVRNQGNSEWSAANNYKLGKIGPKLYEWNFDTGTDGWSLVQNPFGTSGNTSYENGDWGSGYGSSGGGLRTRTGNVNSSDYFNGASTAWAETFNVPGSSNYIVNFKYRMIFTASFESDEYGEVRLEVDDQAVGVDGNVYIERVSGGNGSDYDTGWREFSKVLNLSGPADHTLEIGGWNNKKTQSNEVLEVYVDEVLIIDTLNSPFGGPNRFLIDDLEDEIPKYDGIFRGRPKTFDVQVTAPTAAGTYDLNFLMLQEGVAWFGKMLNVQVEVLAAAYNPNPQDGATDVDPTTLLSFSANVGATGHHLYLGTDQTAVQNAYTGSPEFKADLPLATTTYAPTARLDQGTDYYWRIDETQSAGPPVKGQVWTFTTYQIPGDFDDDLDVDQEDFGRLQLCYSGQGIPHTPGCDDASLDGDNDVDLDDFDIFLQCTTGPNQPANPNCN